MMNRRRAYSFAACALVAAAALLCTFCRHADGRSAYRICSVVREGESGSETLSVKTIYAGESREPHERAASWDALAKEIFWPLGRADEMLSSAPAESMVVFSDPGLPSVPVSLTVDGLGRGPRSAGGCVVVRIELGGRYDAQERADDTARSAGVGAVEITGDASALLCAGEALPVALSMRAERRVVPALWRMLSPGDARVSSIEAAWAKAP